MADYVPLLGGSPETEHLPPPQKDRPNAAASSRPHPRLASLDAFRGLSIALMIFVDYTGSLLPFVAHAPWDGIRLADFVMPFFLFIAGISVSLVYKNRSNKFQATRKAMLRAVRLFLLGILLQGGYFHGINSLSYGVDIDKIRWFGILQRIAVGYIFAALCEIWLSRPQPENNGLGVFQNYYMQWIVVILMLAIYLGLLYGMYVPDWQFKMEGMSSNTYLNNYVLKTVTCNVRGDLGPACNAAGMIDHSFLGIEHLYRKPFYRNLKVCKDPREVPSWCEAPFDPEGIVSTLAASVTCILGLHFGHILVSLEEHKDRIVSWLLFSISTLALGLILAFMGIPLNKSLYTVSYMLVTTGSAGLTFILLYILVDVYGYRFPAFFLEWMGRHSLSIYVLIASNIAVIVLQGFFWKRPQNNIIHFIVSFFVH